MSYKVKEIFYTLQGEGTHAGRPAVFCRFASCNLWTGHEKDRARAICQFSRDLCGHVAATAAAKSVGVANLSPPGPSVPTKSVSQNWQMARARSFSWPHKSRENRMVVCTGGEPLLQLDEAAVDALHAEGFYVAVETNGTQTPPPGIDWLCVSPKIGAPLVVEGGQELKLVHPQAGGDPVQFEHLDFESFRLQPMDGPNIVVNTEATVEYCLQHPNWRLSMQTHKYLGIA